MHIQRKLSVRQRAVSFMLAILMILMCIPSTLTSTMATGPMWGGFGRPGGGNNVLTNVSVSFYDSKFNAITEAESGGLFYLAVQLAGNNVNQNQKDNFRLEITDENLLLPNFAGNGFVDGATYNGFTLHVKADGTRYLDYSIANGETKMIRLQAKFANGTTPNGAKETVKLIRTSSGQSVSNTITAKSSLGWSQNKSQDKSFLSGDAFKNGGEVTVNYTLTATPNNANKSKGAWFASGLHFIDTLKIPDGLETSFSKADLQKVLDATGFKCEIGDFDNKTNPITFDFWVYSKDTSKEMDSVSITVPVTFTCADPVGSITADADTEGTNGLIVKVTGVNDTKEQDIGNSKVSLSVTPPTVPAPNLKISKIAEPSSLDYDEEGWTVNVTDETKKSKQVTYTIEVTNTGDADAENVVLQEVLPEGVSVGDVDGGTWDPEKKTITIGTVKAKSETETENSKTITIKATLTTTGAGIFTNRIYDKDNENNSAYATINVEKKEAKITSDKFGWVGTNPNDTSDKAYKAGEQINYSIIIKNTGTNSKKVPVTDDLSAVVDSKGDIVSDNIKWNENATVTAKKISNGTEVDVSNISTN
ncbi:MAG: DUF11 domain-containing protein, partial [Oscillospiraceae bacterium]|nr:DUF11 domain-containing protein [Oscillospiraceae bacterium]